MADLTAVQQEVAAGASRVAALLALVPNLQMDYTKLKAQVAGQAEVIVTQEARISELEAQIAQGDSAAQAQASTIAGELHAAGVSFDAALADINTLDQSVTGIPDPGAP